MDKDMKQTVDILRFHSGDGECEECVLRDYDGCTAKVRTDAADLIEWLSAELEKTKRERDAAVHEFAYLEKLAPSEEMCSICKYAHCEYEVEPCASCASLERSKWEWRGVCEENRGGAV